MSKFFYSGEIKQENFLTKRDIFLDLIYGKWFNLDIAGFLFIAYSIFVISYQLYFFQFFPIQNILYIIPGFILIIMGSLFLSNYYWLKYKEETINSILKYRGIFDVIYGILLVIFPEASYDLALYVIGFTLILLGLNYILSKKSSFLKKLLGIMFFIVGLSNLNVFSLFFSYAYRVEVFAVFLGLIGIYLIYLSVGYHRSMKAYQDEQMGFTDYKIED